MEIRRLSTRPWDKYQSCLWYVFKFDFLFPANDYSRIYAILRTTHLQSWSNGKRSLKNWEDISLSTELRSLYDCFLSIDVTSPWQLNDHLSKEEDQPSRSMECSSDQSDPTRHRRPTFSITSLMGMSPSGSRGARMNF